jgi:hypothetical protein
MIQQLLSALGLLGVGGLVSSYLTLLWQRKNANLLRHQEYKEGQYKRIILLVYACTDFAKMSLDLLKAGYVFSTREDVVD